MPHSRMHARTARHTYPPARVHTQTHTCVHIHTDTDTDTQTSVHRQTERQTDRQTDPLPHTHTQAYKDINIVTTVLIPRFSKLYYQY